MLKGDSPIQIEWALNGEPISHDYPGISIVTSRRVSLLTIDAVTASHAGEYTCVASNAAGGTSFTATLAVNGTIRVPYPPRFALFFSMHARYSTRQLSITLHSRQHLQSSPSILSLRQGPNEIAPICQVFKREFRRGRPSISSTSRVKYVCTYADRSCTGNRAIRDRRGASELGGHRDRNVYRVERGPPDPNRVGSQRGTDFSQSLRHSDSKHQQTRQRANDRRCDGETRGRVLVLREQRSRRDQLFRISRREWYNTYFPL